MSEKPEQSGFFLKNLIFISGGQTGADIAGLQVANALGISTSGFAAKNYMTENGPNPKLKDFGLIDDGHSYRDRTILNAQISDLTILFCVNFNSPGTKTLENAGNFNIVKIDVSKILKLEQTRPAGMVALEIEYSAERIRAALQSAGPVVNIAGNRESASPGNMERLTKKILFSALIPLRPPSNVA